MGKGGAAPTGEGVQALPGHGNGLGGGQEHVSLVPTEGNEGHLVSAGVRLPQQPHGSALHAESTIYSLQPLCNAALKALPHRQVACAKGPTLQLLVFTLQSELDCHTMLL